MEVFCFTQESPKEMFAPELHSAQTQTRNLLKRFKPQMLQKKHARFVLYQIPIFIDGAENV